MVICVKTLRFFPTVALIVLFQFIIPAKCQVMVKSSQETTTTEANSIEVSELIDDQPVIIEEKEGTETCEAKETTACVTEYLDPEQEQDYASGDVYEDLPDDVVKEKKYCHLLLFGSGALLLVGLCGFICFSRRKRRRSKTDDSLSWDYYDQHIDDSSMDEREPCIVNIMNASPDISETDPSYQNMPLPLIYDDMGKICNNAEMFIQRCMTSSVKRTYSEPVKNVMSSRTRFRDYLKELAYLREKQLKDRQKHGAVKHFFKDVFKILRMAAARERKIKISHAKTAETTSKRSKRKSSEKRRSKSKGKKSKRKPERDPSTSISITSLLLKPQYQARFYKKENSSPRTRRRAYNDEAESLPLLPARQTQERSKQVYIDGRKSQAIEDTKPEIRRRDTEELINFCVNTFRQPINRTFMTLLDTLNVEKMSGAQEFAGTMSKKMTDESNQDRKDHVNKNLDEPRHITERQYPTTSTYTEDYVSLEARSTPKSGTLLMERKVKKSR